MNIFRYTQIISLIILTALSTSISARHRSKKRSHHWKWEKINTTDIAFPSGFIWGSASSALQVEGNTTNSWWTEWENSVDADGKPRIDEKAGIACDHWNRYKEDIKIMKELGLTAYRFSVEWSKIEPEEGKFDQEALDHYAAVCKELVRNGIKPVITLHHYTEPIWFFKKGSFDNPKNIPNYMTMFTYGSHSIPHAQLLHIDI
jgi:beta-glucosidase